MREKLRPNVFWIRFVSSALAICLVTGLMPGIAPIPAKAENSDLLYDFMVTNDGSSTLSSFTDFTKSVNAGSAPWKYGSATGEGETVLATKYLTTAYGFLMYRKGVRSLILRVDAAGRYDASLGIFAYSSSGSTTASLTACDENGAVTGEPLFTNTYDGYSSSSLIKEISFGKVTLNAGYYLLSFTQTTNTNGVINYFKLTAEKTGAVFDVTADAERKIYAGNGGLLNISVTKAGTEEVDWSTVSGVIDSNSDSGVATAAVVKENGYLALQLEAVGTGTTTLTYTVSVNGTAKQLNTVVTVAEQASNDEFFFNLYKLYKATGGTGTDIKTVTSYNMTTKGAQGEINPVYGGETDPWIWGGQSTDGANLRFVDSTYGCMLDGVVGSWASVKIRVSADGYYQLVSNNGVWTSGALVNIYLAPDGVKNPRAQEYFLTQLDSYSSENRWTGELPVGKKQLAAGDYILSWELAGKNELSGGMRFPVMGMYLRKLVDDTDKNLIYDFVKVSDGASNISTYTDFQKSIDEGSAPWKFVSAVASSILKFYDPNVGIYFQLPSSEGAFSLMIDVAQDGYYSAQTTGPVSTGYCDYSVCLTPCDDTGAVTGAQVSLGRVDEYSKTAVTNFRHKLNSVALTKGKYLLTFNARRFDSNAKKIVVNSFELLYQNLVIKSDTPAPVQTGNITNVPLSLSLASNLTADINFDEISISVNDSSIATVTAGADKRSIDIEGLAAGKTAVTLTVWDTSGRSATTTWVVYVYDSAVFSRETYTYNLSKNSRYAQLTEMSAFSRSTAGTSDERNSFRSSDPWRYNASADGALFGSYEPQQYGCLLDLTSDTSIRIRVPAKGKYQLSTTNWYWASGAKLTVTVKNLSGVVLKTFDTFDTYAATAGTDYQMKKVLGTLQMNAGDYIISFAATKSTGTRVAITSLILEGLEAGEEPVTLNATAVTSKKMIAEENTSIPLSLEMSDGSAVDYGKVSIAVDSNTAQDVATASGVCNATNSTAALQISALKAGTTEITYTVSAGSISKQLSIAVTVLAVDTSSNDIIYDFMKTNDGTSKMSVFNDFTYSVEAGSAPWKYLTDSAPAGYLQYLDKTYGFYMGSDGSRTIDLMIDVYHSGTFKPCVVTRTGNNCYSSFTVALIPCDETGTATGDSIAIGSIDCQSDTLVNAARFEFKDTNLEKGKYILRLVVARISRDRNKSILNAFELKAKTLSVTLDSKVTICSDESSTVPVKVSLLSDPENTIAFDSAEVTGADESIATVTAGADKKSLIVTAIGEGTTSANVKFTCGAYSETAALQITVSNNLLFDLMKCNDGNSNLSSFDSFTYSVEAGSEPWKLFSDSSPLSAAKFVDKTYGMYIGSDGTRTVSLMLKVRKEGLYSSNIYTRLGSGYSYFNVSAIQCDESGNPIGVTKKLGTVNCENETTVENYCCKLDNIFLEEGYYLLTLDVFRIDRNRNKSILNAIEFRLLDREALIIGASAPDSITLGETLEHPLNLYLTGNRDVYLPADSVEITDYDDELIAPALSADSKSIVIKALVAGSTNISLNVKYGTRSVSLVWPIQVIMPASSKTAPSYYTHEKVTALRANVDKYSWVQTARKSAIEAAEKYLDKKDLLWQSVTTQELPRGITVGYRHDPNVYYCRYCGANLQVKYGNYPWIMNPINDPWKLQCPDCKRRFPSNDFGSFYNTGIDENGKWSYEKAKTDGAQYLTNDLYPEKGEGWGVDDGYGYHTGNYYTSTTFGQMEEVHTYIAYYNHWGLWYDYGDQANVGLIQDAVDKLTTAYIYTGDPKYGRIGAILIDRIADVYPDMYIKPYFPQFFNSDSTTPKGKIIGCIWEHGMIRTFVKGYDAFYDMAADSQVLDFLSKKAKTYDLGSAKDTSEKLHQNAENNLLRQARDAILDGNIHGNFGMHQSLMAYTAVVLDSMPETQEMIDWIFKSGKDGFFSDDTKIEGGNVLSTLIDNVSRDGFGTEAAPGYNQLWTNSLAAITDALGGYTKYGRQDLFKNPKYVKMLTALYPLTLTRNQTAQIGDSGATANTGFEFSTSTDLFLNTGDIRIAQMIYHKNGNSTDGLYYNDFHQNPEQIRTDIQNIINKYGTYDFDRSEQIAGYGFSILRDGSYYKTPSAVVDNQRDFWLYYGKNGGHGHPDTLNLGIEAYGLNMAPDLGYPEAADGAYKNIYWGKATINHNTVMVNQSIMGGNSIGANQSGTAKHFDDSGRVKVMDVDAPVVYNATSIYRRTVVMVKVNDEVSYGVDFFRVKGGNDHIYSFHSLSDEIYETDLNLVPQVGGTYAGTNVEWETVDTSMTNGFNYLKNVRRAAMSSGNFTVDFKVKDFRNTLAKQGLNLHLRMTMVNEFPLTDVSIAQGVPPQRFDNPEMLEFVLAHRAGTNLDSLFTTVFEPYSDNRYMTGVENVAVTYEDGSVAEASDNVKAVKVTMENGRIDYIVYAADNTKTYRVDDKFNFRGFVGVCTYSDGKVQYAYANDGELIADTKGSAAYTGKVTDFTRELSFDNSITAQFDQAFDPQVLVGKQVYVNNNMKVSGAFEIKGVSSVTDNSAVLDIGDTTLIYSCKDDTDLTAGYNYAISAGQTFRIPLPLVCDDSPEFEETSTFTVDANSQLSFIAEAKRPSGGNISYEASWLPRGASFDKATHAVAWVPDSKQAGIQYISISATGDNGLSTTKYYKIKVLSATSGKETGSSSGGVTNSETGTGTKTTTETGTGISTGNTGAAATERFADLGGYEWAQDAVNSLTQAGIITGTSATTFSPGNNIKRADFTLLLVRALNLKSDEKENFSDVEAGAYYADGLAIAKNSGIITGVGENRFNPTAEISRQDLMVITQRALLKAGYQLEDADISSLSEFTDSEEVSDYAKNAVATLFKNNIISGNNMKIIPKGIATRAEAAVIISRILSLKRN